jgi:hypothetical protein
MRYLLIFLLVLLASCAAPKPAPDAFATAESAIDAAVRAGAEEYAPVELRQYDKSTVLIEQSEINSELAIEKCRTAVVRAQVAEATKEYEALQADFEDTYGEGFQ